jgi:hypothetical protein
MEPVLGRYLEGHPLERQKLLKRLIDLAEGLDAAVRTAVEGREVVFRAGEGGGRGFLRLTPTASAVLAGFPRGSELFDPKRRLSGTPGFQLSLTLRDVDDVDGYVRRLIEEAQRIDAP